MRYKKELYISSAEYFIGILSIYAFYTIIHNMIVNVHQSVLMRIQLIPLLETLVCKKMVMKMNPIIKRIILEIRSYLGRIFVTYPRCQNELDEYCAGLFVTSICNCINYLCSFSCFFSFSLTLHHATIPIDRKSSGGGRALFHQKESVRRR